MSMIPLACCLSTSHGIQSARVRVSKMNNMSECVLDSPRRGWETPPCHLAVSNTTREGKMAWECNVQKVKTGGMAEHVYFYWKRSI